MGVGCRGLPQFQIRREFRPSDVQGRAAGSDHTNFPVLPAWMDESRRRRLYDPRAVTLGIETETTHDLV